MDLHAEPLERERVIVEYLQNRLDQPALEEFEDHYIGCQECFEELRLADALRKALAETAVQRRDVGEITVLGFAAPTELIAGSRPYDELSRSILEQKDTKVLIDMSKVSRIDSAGLGLLMSCYSHVVRNRGSLKLLNPSANVENMLAITRINSVLETYSDLPEAVHSFQKGAR
ncbi:MAG TPA: STAS domain-containing protein [Candidatus Acidoferrum sp.]|jgi:anti-anti-sigma factor|nr:STAS domain-containing protein [Candidatus Acidoferrum sp.]